MDQHGARRRTDMVESLGERGLRVALRNGSLRQIWPGVVVPATRALDPLTRAAAALLFAGPGAVLSGRTAAYLHGCAAAAGPDVHVTVPYTRWVRRRPGLVVHHDRFSADDVVELHGMPALALDLVIAELMCSAPRRVALACADEAIASGSEEDAEEFLDSVLTRLVERDDRRGTRRAAVLLTLVTGKAESPPESWLRLVVIDAGYPVPVAQHEVYDLDGRLLYRLDLAWPELRIALEYDGYEAHEGRDAQDAERDARLTARGWIVLRARATDIKHPERLLGQLATAFAERRYAA